MLNYYRELIKEDHCSKCGHIFIGPLWDVLAGKSVYWCSNCDGKFPLMEKKQNKTKDWKLLRCIYDEMG